MLQAKSENIAGLTCKLKDYINDLDAAYAVFDAQENLHKAKTDVELQNRENDLVILRARVNNQVLIKNYNLGDFIHDIDNTLQDVLQYMMVESRKC